MAFSTSLTTLAGLFPAQFGFRAVANLPKSPLFERLLFENPWALIVILVLGAGVVWIVLNRRGRIGRAFGVSGAMVVVAAGIWILAGQVTTSRETTKLLTRRFIEAVARADVQAVRGLLSSDARLYNVVGRGRGGGSGGGGGVPVDVIVSQVDRFGPGSSYEIAQVAFLDLQSTLDGSRVARTQVRVRVTPVNGGPVFAWFLLDWRRVSDADWEIKGIDLLWSSWAD